jgi:hypothetical protein
MQAVPIYSHGNSNVLKYVDNFPAPVPSSSGILIKGEILWSKSS